MQISQWARWFLAGLAVVASSPACSCASHFLLPAIAAAACPGVGSRAAQSPPPSFKRCGFVLDFLEVAGLFRGLTIGGHWTWMHKTPLYDCNAFNIKACKDLKI